MLVFAVVCPHPPALIPAISRGGADVLDELRRASLDAVQALSASEHDLLVCVGPGPVTRRWGASVGGSLRSLGVDLSYGEGDLELPLSLSVARYLLSEAGSAGADLFQAIAIGASSDVCSSLGRELANSTDRLALLVMGDGSAKRSTTSPGPFDARADSYDRNVIAALGRADPDSLLSLDPGLAKELWVAGRPCWQVLAGALVASGPMRSVVRYDDAPLGVGYFVVQISSATAGSPPTTAGPPRG